AATPNSGPGGVAAQAVEKLLLLLLLLLRRDVGEGGDEAVRWAGGDLSKDREIDVAELFAEGRDDLAGDDLRDDLGLQRFLREAAVDPLVRRHVVVVAAVPHDDVAIVHRAVVRRV